MFWKKKNIEKPVEVETVTVDYPFEVKENGIEIKELNKTPFHICIEQKFYGDENIISISPDKTTIKVKSIREEHDTFDPRETKSDYKVYEISELRTLELKKEAGPQCAPCSWNYWTSVWVDAYVETSKEEIERKVTKVITPMDSFKENGCEYLLIDNEEEFQEYLNFDYDIKMFCDLKLYKKMKSFGLDEDYIMKNATFIRYELKNYNKMLNIMSECHEDKDLFKFLFRRTFIEGSLVYGITAATISQ